MSSGSLINPQMYDAIRSCRSLVDMMLSKLLLLLDSYTVEQGFVNLSMASAYNRRFFNL